MYTWVNYAKLDDTTPGEVPPYMGNVGMCRYGGYGFYTVYSLGPGGGGVL